MNFRIFLAGATLLMPLGAIAVDALPSMPPEEARPDSTGAPDRYTGFNKRVQEKLRGLGFDTGPVNGELNSKTQAALAQFQLSRVLPASGQLDDRTLAELGVERDAQPSAGAFADDRSAQGRALGGSCDALVGPEKERCLQQGGTVEASARSSSGASSPASAKQE